MKEAITIWLLLAVLLCTINFAEEKKAISVDSAGALRDHSWQETLDGLQLRAGYRVEIAAAEPLVVDPVAARLDRHGNLWVVEMPDYPTGPLKTVKNPKAEPSGRVKVLNDVDSDGRFDSSTTFIDGLMFATGVQPFSDGAIITTAGKILFARDTDGDGRADTEEIWFEGFSEGNEQLRANHPTLTPDGRVVIAGGLRGGKIKTTSSRFDLSIGVVDLGSNDFAFELPSNTSDGDARGKAWYGVISGSSQHGISVDDYGRRIGCSNRRPAIEAVLAKSIVDQTRDLTPGDALFDTALAGEHSTVVPISKAWTTSHLHAGQFSAACGVLAPGSGFLGPSLKREQEWLLVCEPTGSLVQRQRLRHDGSVWISRREEVADEFLASPDDWFRPVDLTPGPDGRVLVVDMCRAVIEHPHWAPDELKNRPDTWFGNDRGRVWWIVPNEQPAIQQAGNLQLSTFASWLESNDPWRREMASQWLWEQERTPELETSIKSWIDQREREVNGADRGMTRAIAWLNQSLPSRWINDDHPAAIRASLEPLVTSPHTIPSQMMLETLLHELLQSPETPDHWSLDLLCAADPSWHPLLGDFLVSQSETPKRWIERTMHHWSHNKPGDALAFALAHIEDDQAELNHKSLALLQGIAKGVFPNETDNRTRVEVLKIHRRLRRMALNPQQDPQTRTNCLRVLAQFEQADSLSMNASVEADHWTTQLLHDVEPTLVVEVIRWWMRQPKLANFEELNIAWIDLSPSTRRNVASVLVRASEGANWLLDGLMDGTVNRADVPPATANRLTEHQNKVIRKRAIELLAPEPMRQAVLERYAAAASSDGDVVNGQVLFKQHCSQCHRLNGIGQSVGPDISDSRTKSPAALLAAILDPNAAIDAAYVATQILTEDGSIHSGMLVGNHNENVTLLLAGGRRESFEHDTIEKVISTGKSPMPEGFEKQLNVEQMRDLISYLRRWRLSDESLTSTSSSAR
ncbi:MAG: PVC-type heme-binding CxxCH protein [Planctomycetota bacterium]